MSRLAIITRISQVSPIFLCFFGFRHMTPKTREKVKKCFYWWKKISRFPGISNFVDFLYFYPIFGFRRNKWKSWKIRKIGPIWVFLDWYIFSINKNTFSRRFHKCWTVFAPRSHFSLIARYFSVFPHCVLQVVIVALLRNLVPQVYVTRSK